MENERSLTERFAAIESKLADSKVLLELGKANELPFFIFAQFPSGVWYTVLLLGFGIYDFLLHMK